MTAPDAAAASRLRHDLRTPINHIVGYAELLIEDAEDRGLAERSAPLAAIRDRGKALLNLVDQLTAEGTDRAAPSLAIGRLSGLLGEIVAHCDLLGGADRGDEALARDLAKIRAACERLGHLARALPRV